ncbi:parathyroid hormone/parathyroid hormone-related peptide receptor-like isoform X2 [Schistocerca serialis cubense]|uniref:parathyroid hormone/parathyroid hormone-related peptide receptor-like isoform X2 n=1 Tax=Schistocerca serialis cubense TaxID=2023355 RepID=UPI00214EA413|nr:parathyroid hormone/parathyroid hormone-related peptide receptor-like isoform X2 [Schistocerca serialis cubense]
MAANPILREMEKQKEILIIKEIECRKLNASNAPGTCEPVWDTISCWPETEPGQYQILPCADYILGFDPMKNATKYCYENGTWEHWSNYSQCSDGMYVTVTEQFDETLNDSSVETYVQLSTDISKAGYSISMVSLIFAFTILASVRTLWCPRNILHMNLFLSFILRAFASLLKESSFVLSIGLPSNVVEKSGIYFFKEQPERIVWECKLVISIWQYFILANYSWILMEALYLHNLVFNALFSDRSSVILYIILGWGLPLLFLIPWIICRIFLEDDFCWTLNLNKHIYAIIYVPTAASNIICFILFIRLVRVILTKLQSSVCEQTQIYRRLAKSTLTLIPLFGVHYVVFLAFENSKIGIRAEMVVLIASSLFNSFQGFLVALLYCFLNSEVRTELNKTPFQWPQRRRRNTDASDVHRCKIPLVVYPAAGKTQDQYQYSTWCK